MERFRPAIRAGFWLGRFWPLPYISGYCLPDERKPILEEFKAWLDKYVTDFPESSATGKAFRYALRLWPRLVSYADTGILPIDNNGVEKAIRPFVIG